MAFCSAATLPPIDLKRGSIKAGTFNKVGDCHPNPNLEPSMAYNPNFFLLNSLSTQHLQ